MMEFLSGAWESITQFFWQVWAVLLNFHVRDLLDIFLVALMIYDLIRLIRQTRGVQLLKGLFWLAAAAALAGLFRLEASWFIFRQAIDNAIVLLVVLFQPEIRAVFERLGPSNVTSLKFLSQKNRAELERERIEFSIHQVCEACRQFCAERTGALIVFERVTMLGEIIETGTVIDAKVSHSLIGNIFSNKAPLHDGAAIIRKGRLEAAGCILPLSQNPDMGDFGTRHRAAIGLSEQSDAMAVVVSEETGTLSLAYKGKLMRGLNPEELGEQLRSTLLTQELVKKRFSLGRRKGDT